MESARKAWAIIALVAALTVPSFAAAMVLPPAQPETVHVAKKKKPGPKTPDCKPAAAGVPSPCVGGPGPA